jgi:hypothetical protein
MKMKLANPKLLTGRHGLMLAVTIAALAMVDRAEADCTPPSSTSGGTVVCSGLTTNSSPNHQNGYGTGSDNNNTYTIGAGATVKGDNDGLDLGSGGTINNSGAVTGDTNVGIDGANFTVNNISTSTSAAVISGASVGIAAGHLILNNTGTVEETRPGGAGIQAGSVDVTANSGTIRGGARPS